MKASAIMIGLLLVSTLFLISCGKQPATQEELQKTETQQAGQQIQLPSGGVSEGIDKVAENEVEIGSMI
jgi:PBP1b-binding outer membrane lipoprotein LpoB